MPAIPCEDHVLLQKANIKIADLKEDILQLSDELQKQDSLLSSFMDMACGQSKWIASHDAALQDTAIQDTALLDPSTCPRLSFCLTPKHQSSWAKVVVRVQTTQVFK